MDWRLFNVVFLGISFMLLFTAFQTCSMTEQTVIHGARNEPNSTFTGDGYTSLAVIYGVFAASNWAAPSVVAVCGPKISMILGGVIYCLFIASFLKPMTWSLYLGSALVGFGAAILWTAQGNFLTLNSNKETMARNSGIFWALLQCSLLFGNLYTYFAFGGEMVIDHETRMIMFVILTSLATAGVLVMIFFRSQIPDENDSINLNHSTETNAPGALDAFKEALHLMCTKDMVLLSFTFAYTGFEQTLWSGVFGTSVGATGYFGNDAKALIGLVGIFIGVGEIFGGGLFGLFGKRTIQYGRDPIVLIGFISHVVAAFLIFLSLPQDSPLVANSVLPTYITPNKYVILLCAFLLGFGDSSFNTQIFSLLGSVYSEKSTPAFALFKFIQSVGSTIAFLYSEYILLQWQLLIIVISGMAGAYCFFMVEWATTHTPGQGYTQLPAVDTLVTEDDADEEYSP